MITISKPTNNGDANELSAEESYWCHRKNTPPMKLNRGRSKPI